MPSEVTSLVVEVPEVSRTSVSDSLRVPNLNAHMCSRPLTNAESFYEAGEYFNAAADIAPEFLDQTMKPRGRPHLTLLHLALLDDDLAALSFAAIGAGVYGEEWRYVELWAEARFHREAFLRGCVRFPTRQAIEVDSFRAYWELFPDKPARNLLHRGIWRLSVMGVRDEEPIRVASLRGQYCRLAAVQNKAA